MITLTMQLSKTTKGTYVYAAKAAGQPPAITVLYIQKWAFGNGAPPKEINIQVSSQD